MTLMDLALDTKDYAWAKQLYNLDDETIENKPEIKCELLETKNKTNKEYIMIELEKKDLLREFLYLADSLYGLDDNIKRACLRYYLDSEKDVEGVLNIIKILNQ